MNYTCPACLFRSVRNYPDAECRRCRNAREDRERFARMDAAMERLKSAIVRRERVMKGGE